MTKLIASIISLCLLFGCLLTEEKLDGDGKSSTGKKYAGPCVKTSYEPGDGNINYRSTYTYDANGNILTEETDRHADGTVNYRHTYTYDINGNILTEEQFDHTFDYHFRLT